MSVLLETSVGDIVIDLDVERAPKTCLNFLKLCKLYRYNYCAFFSVQKNFLAQTGDPSSTGKGGVSVWNLLPPSSSDYSPSPYFKPERSKALNHKQKGTVSMALTQPSGKKQSARDDDDAQNDDLVAGSQFFITLADDIDYLDGRHAPFGSVVEGQEPDGALDKMNSAFVDDEQRPLKDIRIRRVHVLDDPFDDPAGLAAPSRTPSPTPEQLASIRLGDDEGDADKEDRLTAEQKEEARRKADSSAAALTLEMVGDLPFAEVRPPENILFVCKLNPVTRSEDLELIFSRFGKVMSCEVVRDKRTGDSLQYAFVEFDEKESAEQAYFKMDAVLIDNSRIRVDFSQSVSKLHGRWMQSRVGQGKRLPPWATAAGSSSSMSPPPRSSNGGGGGGHRGPASSSRGGGLVFDDAEMTRRPPPRERDSDRRRGHGDDGRRSDRRSPPRRYDDDRRARHYERSDRRDHRPHDSRGYDSRRDERGTSSRWDDGRDQRRGDGWGRDRERDGGIGGGGRDRDRDRERDRARHRESSPRR